ncbi:MAG TPA: hypothetical protein PKD77_05600, partial [Rudaea sp.]|nr:hypothetical protein [Rudaea sp.]
GFNATIGGAAGGKGGNGGLGGTVGNGGNGGNGGAGAPGSVGAVGLVGLNGGPGTSGGAGGRGGAGGAGGPISGNGGNGGAGGPAGAGGNGGGGSDGTSPGPGGGGSGGAGGNGGYGGNGGFGGTAMGAGVAGHSGPGGAGGNGGGGGSGGAEAPNSGGGGGNGGIGGDGGNGGNGNPAGSGGNGGLGGIGGPGSPAGNHGPGGAPGSNGIFITFMPPTNPQDALAGYTGPAGFSALLAASAFGYSEGSHRAGSARHANLPAAVNATAGIGGPGIVASGNASVDTQGNISGGLAADGTTRADAVDFSGGGNTLTLENGYSFNGLAVSGGGDTLALGGTSNASFDLSQIGASAEFQGFSNFAKTGTSTWTANNSNTSTNWTIGGGTLLVSGSIGNVDANAGTLSGTGTVAAITLANGGAIAPGGSPGALNGASLTWNGGGSFNFQLGNTAAASDQLALTGMLSKGSGSGFVFHFADAAGPPQVGVTYTLITFTSQSGFSIGDFSYDYSGANPGLGGVFALSANALTFTPTAMPVTLQSFSVD